jgi:hypothetical protein
MKSFSAFAVFFWLCVPLQACADKEDVMIDYDKEIVQQQKEDLESLEQVKECDFSRVILVQLFDAYVPIPNTYYFSNRRSQDWVNEFSRQLKYGVYEGLIMFGYYEKLKESSFASLDAEIMYDYEEKFKRDDLNVVNWRLKDLYDTDVFTVHDGKEFIMVQDHNSKLWEAMIEGYEFLAEGGCDLQYGK